MVWCCHVGTTTNTAVIENDILIPSSASLHLPISSSSLAARPATWQNLRVSVRNDDVEDVRPMDQEIPRKRTGRIQGTTAGMYQEKNFVCIYCMRTTLHRYDSKHDTKLRTLVRTSYVDFALGTQNDKNVFKKYRTWCAVLQELEWMTIPNTTKTGAQCNFTKWNPSVFHVLLTGFRFISEFQPGFHLLSFF